MSGDSRERSEDVSILGRKAEGEALRNIINKLSDESNLRELHLKHHHMSCVQFKKRTIHLDIPWTNYDLYRHVVKTCPFCNWTKPRPERSRVRGLWAEEFGDLIFLDHGSARIGDETFGFRIVLDGATSPLTANPCKSTSPSEVIDKVHQWMDTFQMNPKGICSDMAFHQPHDMQVFCRMQRVKRLPTGPRTPWPNRAEMVFDCSRNFSGHSWIQPPKTWTRPLWHISPLPSLYTEHLTRRTACAHVFSCTHASSHAPSCTWLKGRRRLKLNSGFGRNVPECAKKSHLITRCHVSLASQTSTSLRAARNPTHNHCSSAQRRVWPNGRLDLSNTGWEPNIGINVSAEHTPIHMPSDSFNENATIAASDEFAPMQRVESSSRHSNTVEFGTTHSMQGTVAK